MNLNDELKAKLLKKFEARDLGILKSFLGINFLFNEDHSEVSLDQSKLIKRICERFNVKDKVTTPMEIKLNLHNVIGTYCQIEG